jgi:hypothetical protein
MDKWEYKCISPLGGESAFNKLGQEGWEMVQYIDIAGAGICFKRKLPSSPQQSCQIPQQRQDSGDGQGY